MGFRLQQKLMTLNDLERQSTVVRVMRIVTKRLKLRSCSFNYSLAQCRISLPAQFDYKIRQGSPPSGG